MRWAVNVPRFEIILAALPLAACSSPGMQTAQMEDPESRLYQIQERETAHATQHSQLSDYEAQLAQQQHQIAQQMRATRSAESRALAGKPSPA